MVHAAGHSPGAFGLPGMLTETSTYPVVKQNLFHVDIIPPWKCRSCVSFRDKVTVRLPFCVVMAAGSYHSMLLVCQ